MSSDLSPENIAAVCALLRDMEKKGSDVNLANIAALIESQASLIAELDRARRVAYEQRDIATTRIAELEQRLELFDEDGARVPDAADGISCRDETLKLQDAHIDRLAAELALVRVQPKTAYIDEHTEAWYACVDQLKVSNPRFLIDSGLDGIECAVNEIKRLQSLTAPETGDAHAFATKDEIFKAGETHAKWRFHYLDALHEITEAYQDNAGAAVLCGIAQRALMAAEGELSPPPVDLAKTQYSCPDHGAIAHGSRCLSCDKRPVRTSPPPPVETAGARPEFVEEINCLAQVVSDCLRPNNSPIRDCELRDIEKALRGAALLLASKPSPPPPVETAKSCIICGSDEPRTGTCGSPDPRALCNQPSPPPSKDYSGLVAEINGAISLANTNWSQAYAVTQFVRLLRECQTAITAQLPVEPGEGQ